MSSRKRLRTHLPFFFENQNTDQFWYLVQCLLGTGEPRTSRFAFSTHTGVWGQEVRAAVCVLALMPVLELLCEVRAQDARYVRLAVLGGLHDHVYVCCLTT